MSGTGTSASGAGASGTSGSGAGAAGAANRGNFVERQQQGQFLASRLVGTTVYGTNNERVGDVNDVLMDRDGKAQALVIGVGGFLGIGEKDVAVPFNAVEFASGDAGRTGTTAGAPGGPGGPGTAAGTTGAGGTTGTAGGTGTSGGMATTGGSTGTMSGVPDRIILRMTRDQLNAAPQFARLGDNTTGGGNTTGSGARTNTNPPGSTTGTGANPTTGTGAGGTTR